VKGIIRKPTPKNELDDREGRCWELAAAKLLSLHSDTAAVLIHGTILTTAGRIAHAWVRLADGTIYEPVGQGVYGAELFAWAAKAEIIAEYDVHGMISRMNVTGHIGPWSQALEPYRYPPSERR